MKQLHMNCTVINTVNARVSLLISNGDIKKVK